MVEVLTEPYTQYGFEFSESGITTLTLCLAITVLSNAFAYLLVKSFNVAHYYGRFIGGVVILILTLLLTLASNSLKKYKGIAMFGIGEILVGILDIISYVENLNQPILIPDVNCSET